MITYKEILSEGDCTNELVKIEKNISKTRSLLISFHNENQKYKEVFNKIKNICDKVPYDWSVCGIEVVHKIEKILKEVEDK